MTDASGRRPRTATIALLAPAAAAVFAGSVAWAAGHPPPSSGAGVAPVTGAPAARVEDIDRLRQEVRSLQAELSSLPGSRPVRTAPPPVHATTGAS